MRDIVIAGKLAILIKVSGRERHHALTKAHKVLCLAREDDHAFCIKPIVERTDAEWIAGSYVLTGPSVIDDAGKFRIKCCEHVGSVLTIQGEKDLAIAVALKRISLLLKLFLRLLESVKLSVADNEASVKFEGLHAFGSQSHDRKSVKTELSFSCIYYPAVIGSAGDRFLKTLKELLLRNLTSAISHY